MIYFSIATKIKVMMGRMLFSVRWIKEIFWSIWSETVIFSYFLIHLINLKKKS